jgi:hypothetical protein
MNDLPIIFGMLLLFTIIMFGLPAALLILIRRRKIRLKEMKNNQYSENRPGPNQFKFSEALLKLISKLKEKDSFLRKTTLILLFLFLAVIFLYGEYAIYKGTATSITYQSNAFVPSLIFMFIWSMGGFLVFLSFLPRIRYQPTKVKVIISIGLTTLLVVISYVNLIKTVKPLIQYDEKYWTAMHLACSGKGTVEAKAYEPDKSIHKVVPINRNLDSVPKEWQPDSLSNTELVLCFGDDEEILIDYCRYYPSGIIDRIQNKKNAYLVAARTGEVIAQNTFSGTFPEPCPYVTRGSGKIVGSAVKVEDMLVWMSPYVER